MNRKNDLYLGLNDMQIIQELNKEFLDSKLDYINDFETIVIDNNLSEESIGFLLKRLTGKLLVMDAVSAHKAHKLKNHLNKISILKLSQLELDALSSLSSSKDQLEDLHAKGAHTVLLTHQENESIVSRGENYISQKPKAIRSIVNTTGAGDAFLSGYLHGFLLKKSEEDRLKMANFAAGLTIVSEDSTSRELNSEKLQKATDE